MENAITSSHGQVLKLAHYKTPIQVIMKIGGENIQVITVRLIEIMEFISIFFILMVYYFNRLKNKILFLD
jgi:hypothetical protein